MEKPSAAPSYSAEELRLREAALAQREAEVAKQEKQVKKRMRDNLYDRIPVSARSMRIVNWVIGITVALLFGALLYGVIA